MTDKLILSVAAQTGLPVTVVEAFDNLAHEQRGEPERVGAAINSIVHLDTQGWLIENVGDLTHRMNKSFHLVWDYNHYFADKVRPALRSLRFSGGVGYAIARQQQQHADSLGITLGEFQARLRPMLKAYAHAHAKLPVYNAAQWYAREAAVAIGLEQYADAEKFLSVLDGWVNDPEVWRMKTHAYRLGPNGYPMQIVGTPKWRS